LIQLKLLADVRMSDLLLGVLILMTRHLLEYLK